MFKQNLCVLAGNDARPAQLSPAAKTGYTTPQLVAVGRTVELIQGYGAGYVRDHRTGYYYLEV
jgi:hypothetical protein